MIIKSNAVDVAGSLDTAIEEIERRLKAMVVGFAGEVASTGSDNTPVGSPSLIQEEGSYRNYYLRRQDDFGLPLEEGYHAGAWQYTESSPVFIRQIFTKNEMLDDVIAEADLSYRIGETFKIAATGPGYGALEKGSSQQASQGIMTPTTTQIMTAHAADLKRHYDAG